MKNSIIFLLIVCVLSIGKSFGQSNKEHKIQHWSVSADYGQGFVLKTNPFVEGENQNQTPVDHYRFTSLRMIWQNPGYKTWQQIYRGPYYGLGISLGDIYHPEEIGCPISYYGILGIPVFRTKRYELYSEFQFGVASHWESYDSISNPYNIVIGGALTVHLNVGFKSYYHLNDHFDIGAGFSFIHFSNGGMERPNRGFNIVSPSLELKYHIHDRPDFTQLEKAKPQTRSNDLLIQLGYGNHQLVEHELDSNYYAIGGISAIYYHQMSNAFRLGGGVDLNYWWGMTAQPDGSPGALSFDNLTLGLIVQPEFIIDKLSLTGGVGIYARHLHYGSFQQLYQRLGVRYDFYDNISFGVNIRSVNFVLAEFLEFNLGYRFRWPQK